MTEIIAPKVGKNSPRQAWLPDFNLAFVGGDIEKTLGFVAEDVTWELVGEGTIKGRDGMRAWLQSMAGKQARRVEFRLFITHGRSAAVNGSYEMESGSKFEFCDIYEFANAKNDSPITNYTSYVVRV
ncbi:MAG TPA: nuclear transport factor 2 family protein [Solirubrobacterales bacterium]|nr:nuclear transport factor 2 family protein [Solirubrobacterales bacterium]HNK35343.1 nuclear transport factor 2 family protein [Solirubrobacterales bacterium]